MKHCRTCALLLQDFDTATAATQWSRVNNARNGEDDSKKKDNKKALSTGIGKQFQGIRNRSNCKSDGG